MKAIGLLGGMSWESTAVYYRTLNELTKERLGPTHSCPLVLYSFDFEPLRQLSFQEEWNELSGRLAGAAKRLESAGAECVMICANTMHRCADEVQRGIAVPVLSLIDAVGVAAQAHGFTQLGLLGTMYTMQGAFYRDRLADSFHLETRLPSATDHSIVNRAIYDELTQGLVLEPTTRSLIRIVEELADQGAQAVILGCTELPLALSAASTSVPLIDTTRIHCEAAIAFADS